MSKIKRSPSNNDKVKKSQPQKLEHIVFSFSRLTKNNDYGLRYWRREHNNKALEFYTELLKRLQELCQYDIVTTRTMPKTQGSEVIPYSAFKRPVQNVFDGIDIISKDSDITVSFFHNIMVDISSI